MKTVYNYKYRQFLYTLTIITTICTSLKLFQGCIPGVRPGCLVDAAAWKEIRRFYETDGSSNDLDYPSLLRTPNHGVKPGTSQPNPTHQTDYRPLNLEGRWDEHEISGLSGKEGDMMSISDEFTFCSDLLLEGVCFSPDFDEFSVLSNLEDEFQTPGFVESSPNPAEPKRTHGDGSPWVGLNPELPLGQFSFLRRRSSPGGKEQFPGVEVGGKPSGWSGRRNHESFSCQVTGSGPGSPARGCNLESPTRGCNLDIPYIDRNGYNQRISD